MINSADITKMIQCLGRLPQPHTIAILFVILTSTIPAQSQEAPNPGGQKSSQPSIAPGTSTDGGKPQGLFDALLDTAVKAAGQVDRVGLEMTRMTEAQESALGAEIDKEILRHTPALDNPAMKRRIDKLAAPLINQRQRRAINYTVRILESEVVNAYSIAGGYVYITSAFLKEFPSDAAVAMTLGHEIGHVDLRHCVEKVQYEVVGRQVVGDVAALAQLAYGNLRSAYTKEQEFEADKYGFEAATRAGWKSVELLAFIRSLVAYEQKQIPETTVHESGQPIEMVKKLSEYLATHPSSTERLRRLERIAGDSESKSTSK